MPREPMAAQGGEEPDWLTAARPKDPLMAWAWEGALWWAMSDPDALKAFSEATGVRYSAPRTKLDQMIDEATGAQEGVARAFVEWFTANVWDGDPEDADDATASTSPTPKSAVQSATGDSNVD